MRYTPVPAASAAATIAVTDFDTDPTHSCLGCDCRGGDCPGQSSGSRGDRDSQPGRRGLHGVGGDDDDQSAGADGDAAFGKQFPQTFDGAIDAFLRGLVTDAESLRHFVRGFLFEVAEQESIAVRLAQFTESVVELRSDLFPVVVGRGGEQIIHDGSLLFADPAADVGADGLRRDVLRGAMQPAGQHRAVGELTRVFRESDEDTLRHVLGEVRITHHAQRGRIDEIDVAPHEFREGGLGPPFGVLSQKLLVVQTVHSPKSSRRGGNRTSCYS